MRQGITIIVLAWLMVFLQASLAGFITIRGVAPDLLCVLITLVALRLGSIPAMRLGFLVGFLSDCYHPSTMGLYSLCYTAAAFAGAAVRDRIYREKLSGQIVAAAVMTLFIVPLAVMLRSGGGYVPLLLRVGVGSALYTAAVAAVALPLLTRALFPVIGIRGER